MAIRRKKIFGSMLLVFVLAISLNINTIAYNFGSTTFNDHGHELLNKNFDDGLAHWSVSGGSSGITSSGFQGAAVYLTTSPAYHVRLSQSLDSSLVSRVRGKTLTFSFMFKSSVVGDQARAMVRYTTYEPTPSGGGGGGGNSPLPTPRSVASLGSETRNVNVVTPSIVKAQTTTTSPVHRYLYGSWENRSTDPSMPWEVISGKFSIPASAGGYQVEEIAVIISLRNTEGRNVYGYVDSAEISISLGTWFNGQLSYYHSKLGPQVARTSYGIDVNIFSLGDLPGSYGTKKVMFLGVSAQAYIEDGVGIDQIDLKVRLLPDATSSSTQRGKLDAIDVMFADNRPFITGTSVDNSAQEIMFRLTKAGLSTMLYQTISVATRIPPALIKLAAAGLGVNDEINGVIDTLAGMVVGRSDPLIFDSTADAYTDSNDDTIRFQAPSFNSFSQPLGGDPYNTVYNVASTSTVSAYLIWIYDTGHSGYGLSISAKFNWGYWISDSNANTWYKNNIMYTMLDYTLMVS